MRFSFTCLLSFFLLVTTAAAIPVPRESHQASSLSRRNSYDDVVELDARAKTPPPLHHPRAWGKTEDKKLPTKSKQQRKEEHKAQQAVAGKTRNNNYLRRQKNLAKQGKAAPVTSKKEGHAARKQAVLAKKEKVQAKAKSTQLEAKERLAERKAAGRMKFDIARKKYEATESLPNRKTTFTTPGGQSTFVLFVPDLKSNDSVRLTAFTGADTRRAVWNTHRFTGSPTNYKVREDSYRTIRDILKSAPSRQSFETLQGLPPTHNESLRR